MSTGVIAWIRTISPVLVGSLVAWLLTLGIDLDAGTQTGLITGLTGFLIAGYYTLARLLEKQFPVLGVLLGVPKTADSYSKGDIVSIDVPELDVADTSGVVEYHYSESDTPVYDLLNGKHE